jgi:hypothetical protein
MPAYHMQPYLHIVASNANGAVVKRMFAAPVDFNRRLRTASSSAPSLLCPWEDQLAPVYTEGRIAPRKSVDLGRHKSLGDSGAPWDGHVSQNCGVDQCNAKEWRLGWISPAWLLPNELWLLY